MGISRAHRAILIAALSLVLPLASLATSQTAWAQDASSSAATDASAPAEAVPSPTNPLTADQIVADRAVWKKADCSNCHGWSGNGHDTGPVPPGPSLRDTQLDYVSIRETAQCGRPATNMPSHDRLAYTDDRCYGMTSADVGTSKPPKGVPLKADELDAIAAYVAGYLQGRGPVTKAECEEYFAGANPSCSTYAN